MASAPAPEAEVAEEAPLQPIIVKKIIAGGGDGHHGGAWKVAYADFVTAMMAFFLLMWLLGATTEDQRKGLADYFTPTLVSYRTDNSAGADGMLGGSSITDVDNYPNAAGQTGTQAITIPRDVQGGPTEGGAAQAERRRVEIAREIQEQIERRRELHRLARQVRVMRTDQGIRIDLVDDADFSMFHIGSTILVPEAQQLLGIIADAVAELGSQMTVRGHTDATPWRAGSGANNWSLSTGRAEATRQQLLLGGIAETRFSRIEGVADRELLIHDNPMDPRNRRISITLLD